MTQQEIKKLQLQQQVVKKEITAVLLAQDRQRAADVLLQLHYQFSRTTSTIQVK